MKTKKLKEVGILLASPSDVNHERQIVREMIQSANHIASLAKFQFTIYDWEHDTYPTACSQPQPAINSQTRDKFSVVIALFWSRLGTPTEKYASGTVEEIEVGIIRSKKNMKFNVKVYFKTTQIPAEILLPEQFEKLRTYKEDLMNRGYIWQFNTDAELQRDVVRHLGLFLNDRIWPRADDLAQINVVEEAKIEFEKSAKMHLTEATEIRGQINEINGLLANLLTKNAKAYVDENSGIDALAALPKSDEARAAIKDAFNTAATRMAQHASLFKEELDEMQQLIAKLFNSYTAAVLLNHELNQVDKFDLRESLKSYSKLKESYFPVMKQADILVKLLLVELKSSNFPTYSRSLRKTVEVHKLHKKVMEDSVKMMDNLIIAADKIIH